MNDGRCPECGHPWDSHLALLHTGFGPYAPWNQGGCQDAGSPGVLCLCKHMRPGPPTVVDDIANARPVK
jgi:hypothetical protein